MAATYYVTLSEDLVVAMRGSAEGYPEGWRPVKRVTVSCKDAVLPIFTARWLVEDDNAPEELEGKHVLVSVGHDAVKRLTVSSYEVVPYRL